MMHSNVLDYGLMYLIKNSKSLSILTDEPIDYADAKLKELGQKIAPLVTGPMNNAPTGRGVVVQAITDGQVDKDGTATHWALLDPRDPIEQSRCLVSGPLLAPKSVISGNAFTLEEITIVFPGVTLA